MQKPVVETPKGVSRLEPGGCGPVSSARPLLHSVRLRAEGRRSAGGHGEGLRRSRGEAAGEKLDAHPVNWSMVNVGTAAEPPLPLAQPG